MSCNLIRLRCERLYELEVGKKPDWPGPDYRLFDVPPGVANQIACWFREQGWDVLEEAICGFKGKVCVHFAYRPRKWAKQKGPRYHREPLV